MADQNERNRVDSDTSEAVGTGVGAVAGAAVGSLFDPLAPLLVQLLEEPWATRRVKVQMMPKIVPRTDKVDISKAIL